VMQFATVNVSKLHANNQGVPMNHTQHAMTEYKHRRLGKRAEAAFDYLLCLAIGTGLAALLVAWWSS